MTENESTDEPIPGWPSPPVTGSEGAPHDPTVPGSPFPVPPPAAPGAYPPPNVPPPPASYVPPSGYPPPNVPPAPGSYGGGYAPPAGYGYGPPGAYGGYAPRDHPQGTTVLVLGIVSWVICGLCAPFAWVMGNNALREIDRNPAAYSNRGAVQAGRILGMIYTILMLLGLAFIVVIIVIGAFAGTTSS